MWFLFLCETVVLVDSIVHLRTKTDSTILPKALAKQAAVVEVECGSCAPAAAAAAAERRSDAGSMNTRDELPVRRTPLVLLVVPRDASRDLLY